MRVDVPIDSTELLPHRCPPRSTPPLSFTEHLIRFVDGAKPACMATNTQQSNAKTPQRGLPEPVKRVMEIFERRDDALRFPGIDAATLAARAEGIERLSQAVTEATLQLEAAERAKQAEEQELAELARRAYAYAKVYAEGDDELKRELESVDFELETRPRRKRSRPAGAARPIPRTTSATPARADGGRAHRKTAPTGDADSQDSARVA